LLALLIESKCDDALPIHRQCDQLSRLGFEVPVETLYGYWRYATDLLLPVSDALLGTVLDDPWYVALDDTGLDVLDRGRKDGKYRGHLWCFSGSRTLVAYAFTETWKAEEIAPWIHAIPPDVFIQVDDYAGYGTKLIDPEGKLGPLVPPHRRLGCMMHVRRRFFAALKLGDKRAAIPVGLIKELYEVEQEAHGLSPAQRLALRSKRSLPILDKLDAWVDAHDGQLGKTGKLAEAVRYAKQQREFVRRCFSDGRFEIDNGAVERAIREPALGRKNFLFSGSAAAARRLAGAYSLVQTCRALGICTRDYLIDVLEKLEGGWPMRRLVELLPHNWATARALPLVTA
jgi:transposase